jgi:folate-binding Fe-S cluster repair protein YgfZ
MLTVARLSRKSVLEVTGPDARKFLKGQTCKDVDALAGGYSGFLNASVRRLLSRPVSLSGGAHRQR